MSTRTTPQPGPTTAARGFLLVVLAALCWGTSGITGDVVAGRTGLDPLDIAWHRMAIGAPALLAGHPAPPPRGAPRVATGPAPTAPPPLARGPAAVPRGPAAQLPLSRGLKGRLVAV